jgi:hypothetical protein
LFVFCIWNSPGICIYLYDDTIIYTNTGGGDLSRTSSAIRRRIYSPLGLPIFLHLRIVKHTSIYCPGSSGVVTSKLELASRHLICFRIPSLMKGYDRVIPYPVIYTPAFSPQFHPTVRPFAVIYSVQRDLVSLYTLSKIVRGINAPVFNTTSSHLSAWGVF